MADLSLIAELATEGTTKIVLLVMDGLGGMPVELGGPTELEAARTPNMDRLAAEGTLGLHIPVRPGLAPGSGYAHLALFGYDPLRYPVGRGVLEALGIGFPLEPHDIAARGNFVTVNAEGRIVDRRAGRIPTEVNARLVERLRTIRLEGVEALVEPVKEHRFVLVLRGEGLSPALTETDPGKTGVLPLPVRPLQPEAERTAALVNRWIEQARALLTDAHPANMVTLRGFDGPPRLPRFSEVYKLRAAAIAAYPMYRGVARLVGMEVLEVHGESPEALFQEATARWEHFDFFFIHIKPTDSRGEDGDFAAKVRVIEAVDAALPILLERGPDVLVITGDHSTPAALRTHTWHPVPVLLWAPRTARPDGAPGFGERACRTGGLGIFMATDLMPLILAHAGRLSRLGA